MKRTTIASALITLLLSLALATACRDREAPSPVAVELNAAVVDRDGDHGPKSSAYERISLGSGVALDVNSRGQIAGWLKSDDACSGACAYHAVLWEKGTPKPLEGVNIYLDDPRTDPFYNWNMPLLAPLAINNRGDVVGSYMPGPGAPYHAFWWHDGTLEDFGPGHAYDINERGQITVLLGTDDTGFGAAVWEDGSLTSIGGGTDGPWPIPIALNNRGEVVGFHVWSLVSGGFWFGAFLWDDGVMHDLGFPPNANASALDINEQGQIVGNARTSEGTYVGFVWKDGALTEVGIGLEHTWILSIGPAGRFVGNWSAWVTSWIPFVWESGEMHPLPGGADDYPVSINSRGQIVGYHCAGGCVGLTEVTALRWEPER